MGRKIKLLVWHSLVFIVPSIHKYWPLSTLFPCGVMRIKIIYRQSFRREAPRGVVFCRHKVSHWGPTQAGFQKALGQGLEPDSSLK